MKILLLDSDLNKLKDDHFVKVNGELFAGHHYLIDMWEVNKLDDKNRINDLLLKSAKAARATVLHIHSHHFGNGQGISGIAILAESHISIHTWPERDYAALDVFMCGQVSPLAAVSVLRKAFQPTSLQVKNYKRGVTD